MPEAELDSMSMDRGFTVTFEGDYVLVGTHGVPTIEHARAVWTEVARVCEENNCFVVLGISRAPEPMPIVDAFRQYELFAELGIDSRYKIAFIEANDENRKVERFAEDVLFNRGLPGKVFANDNEAREWLFSDAS